MRRWLLSYTSLLVFCNQCSTKKAPTTATTVNSELEMRLIGLLSVDIDLETVDINQCEMPKKMDTVMPEVVLETHKELDELTNQKQQDNQSKNYQKNNANQLIAQENYKFDNLVSENRFQINSLQFNNSIINQPQRLISSSAFIPPFVNGNLSNDKFTSNNKYANRIILNFEKTNKCHQTTSKVRFLIKMFTTKTFLFFRENRKWFF
jgi:hypothetical protein